MVSNNRRVSVIVPAYNASKTIAETLLSVRRQTHADLEIIIVDDGSTDGTLKIVEHQAAEDSRIRIVKQRNGGVAAARNAGAAAASGGFIAPIDADDLWHPTKIERQLQIFEKGGPRLGLVYTWFVLIDEKSRVLQFKFKPELEGEVAADLALYNFIGNGSSAMIRSDVFAESPGYDTSLRSRGGQGCEDWKLYFQIAEKHHFGVVRAPLTGYRILPDNMSSNVLEMLRSRDLATSDLLPNRSHLAAEFRAGRNRLSRLLFHRAIRRGRFNEIAALALSIGRHDPRYLAALLAALPKTALAGVAGRLFGNSEYAGRNAVRFGEAGWDS